MAQQKKMGRPPISGEKMTKAEYQRRYRAKKKAESKSEAYFVFPDNALEELTTLAETYGVKRSVLLSGIVEGQMLQLKKFESMISLLDPEAEDLPLRRKQALQLIYKGESLLPLLLELGVGEAADQRLEKIVERYRGKGDV